MKSEALEIHVILEHVLKFLNVDELKRIRHVNKFWSCEGNQLFFHSFVRVPSKFHKLEPEEKKRQVKALTSFFHPREREREKENGIKRPGRVSFVRIEQKQDFEILTAVKILGKNVYRLHCFWPEDDYPKDQDELLIILRSLLPDLRSLKDFYFWSEDVPYLISILSRPLATFIEAGKAHVIKGVEFEVDFEAEEEENPEIDIDFPVPVEKQIEIFEAFSQNHPQLQSISFGLSIKYLELGYPAQHLARFITAINNTLESSADSIQEMELSDSLSDVPGFKMPAIGMKNLKSLEIALPSESRANIPVFPHSAQESFKSLSKVTIGIEGRDWLDRAVYKKISPSVVGILLPEMALKLELEFAVHEYSKNGRNYVLLAPPDSSVSETFDTLKDNEHPDLIQRTGRELVDYLTNFFFWCTVIIVLAIIIEMAKPA